MAKAAGARCGSGAQEGLGDRAERDEGQLCRRPRADRPPRWPCLAAIVLVEQAEFARPDQAVTGNLGARCAAPWLARWVSSGEGWGLLHGHRWGLSHGHGESFRARPSVSPSAGFDRKSADSRSDRHGAAFQADAMDRIHEGDLGLNPAGPPTVGSLAHRRPHLVGCQARQPGGGAVRLMARARHGERMPAPPRPRRLRLGRRSIAHASVGCGPLATHYVRADDRAARAALSDVRVRPARLWLELPKRAAFSPSPSWPTPSLSSRTRWARPGA